MLASPLSLCAVGVGVIIDASQALDPGSNPGRRISFQLYAFVAEWSKALDLSSSILRMPGFEPQRRHFSLF